jgi:hypothetical protein
MKKLVLVLAVLGLSACGRYIQTEDIDVGQQSSPQPISVVVNVGGSTVTVVAEGGNSSATGGNSSANGGSSSATGGSNTNDISSGNSSATGGSGGSGGAGGTGGGASAGNSTSNANNSGSSNNTNSGSASNQANNSTNNSSDNNSSIEGSGNSTNSNSNANSNANTVFLDFDFNMYLEGYENYFALAKKAKPKAGKCVDPMKNKNILCHVYDFQGRSKLATDLAGAPHLGSFYMDAFDVTPRDWQQGFPKFPAELAHLREYYAVRCFTKLKVKKAGLHKFSMTSDDGMRFILNGYPVLEDDSLHAPRTVTTSVNLVKGTYNMEVQWFQGPRVQIAAELKWQTPDCSGLNYILPKDTKKPAKICK